MGGGGSHHETHFDYVDHTVRNFHEEQRREQERLAEERRQRELEELRRIEQEKQALIERERQRYLEEQELIKRAVEESIRQENERLERERQRLRQLELKATTERQGLFDYSLGEKTRLRNVKSLNLGKLRIGVFGPTGSGKSCFINTCERAVRQTDKGSVPISTSGSEGTIILEDYLAEMFFRLVDTRGFFNYDHHETKELNDILYGRIKSGDFIGRGQNEPDFKRDTKVVPYDEWLHGVILVVKANDVRLRNGSLEMYLKPVRETLQAIGMSPVTVVTHHDTLKSLLHVVELNAALEHAALATGSTRNHTFFVSNYCPDNPGPDVNSELQIFEILNCSLKVTEEYIANAKEKKIEKIEREMTKVLNGTTKKPDSIVSHAPIDVFLTIMNTKYRWSGIDVETLTELLMDQDVTTLEMLASCWIEINTLLPLCVMTAIEADLRKMLMI